MTTHTLECADCHVKRRASISMYSLFKRQGVGKRCKSCVLKNNKRGVGRVDSPEHRRKISEANKGKTLSPEHIARISGPNHYKWKGGDDTAERIRFKNHFRPLILARDNYTCQMCFNYGNHLHVDHIKEWANFPELRFDLDNCRTLCRACHYYITFKRRMPKTSTWGLTGATAHRRVA